MVEIVSLATPALRAIVNFSLFSTVINLIKMRTTRASAAIDRLKRRSGNTNYSMVMSSNGLFSLVLPADMAAGHAAQSTRLCEPMPMDEFVVFVNAYGPQIPKRVSKLEVAFSAQLAKSKSTIKSD